MDSTVKENKPTLAVDEMFPEGAGFMDLEESGGSTGLMMDLTTNEKHVHADFYNNFDDIFDDDEHSLPSFNEHNLPVPAQQQQH